MKLNPSKVLYRAIVLGSLVDLQIEVVYNVAQHCLELLPPLKPARCVQFDFWLLQLFFWYWTDSVLDEFLELSYCLLVYLIV